MDWGPQHTHGNASNVKCLLVHGNHGDGIGVWTLELRHLRCFLAVAEELQFARAAERLHIEQSPLSRVIKELEEDLGVRLFERTTRSTRLTRAGRLFLDHAPRVFATLEQARNSVKALDPSFHVRNTEFKTFMKLISHT